MKEPDSDVVRETMEHADEWFMCRAGYVETVRAVALAAGIAAAKPVMEEWPAFGIVEVDQALVERAAELAIDHDLRSLDSLHLAAAMVLPLDDLAFVTWDRRLQAAAAAEGLLVTPRSFD